MNIMNTPAISLKVNYFNEADGIVTFYTQDYGLLKTLIKGIKKPVSKLVGASEILALNSIYFVTGKNMNTLTGYERIKSFGNIRQNLDRLAIGSLWTDIIRFLGKEHDPDSGQIYELVAKKLYQLDDISVHSVSTSLIFHTDMLKLAGYLPAWESCIACKTELEFEKTQYYPFFVTLGGFLCSNCRTNFPSLQGVNVSTGTIQLLLYPQNITLYNYSLKAHKFLAYYWINRIEREIKSFDFLLKLMESESNLDKKPLKT